MLSESDLTHRKEKGEKEKRGNPPSYFLKVMGFVLFSLCFGCFFLLFVSLVVFFLLPEKKLIINNLWKQGRENCENEQKYAFFPIFKLLNMKIYLISSYLSGKKCCQTNSMTLKKL